ncbi:MAG TPA: M3 family oligoendopeptidase [Chthonomonadales bacterium]|nr:M3 family oligoendopeptidase [Chthonomonadales bacterium]
MSEQTLPRWDMTTIYPSIESPEFTKAFDAMVAGIGELEEMCQRHGVRRRAEPEVDAAFAAAYDEVTGRLNALLETLGTLWSYVLCHTSTDATDEAAQARESLLHAHYVRVEQLLTRYAAWVGSSDAEALIAASPVAAAHAYAVRRARVEFEHQMSEPEEELAASLAPSSISAWARLHSNATALLTATVRVRGEDQRLPMSKVRALATDPDREVRRAAYEAELRAWESLSVPLAAAMNGVKGYQNTLRRRRGWTDDVEPTLFHNGIDRQTLDAMQGACIEAFGDFRRYLRAKARALGLEKLAWYDLLAPVGSAARTYTWNEAEAFVRDNFVRYSQKMAVFAERAFRERWVDAEPRVGKEGGAYCTDIRGDESRVMMNFDGSFSSVSTLAHELGHAYHNLCLAPRTPIQRSTPSTLAETASIFCETLAFNAALDAASPEERITLLDTSLEGSTQVVVDIHSRFLFEQRTFARRAERDLTIAELRETMLQAQREAYGDAVDPLHADMWAVKGHYYGPTFYNYPYTFGLLFGLGLYARYREDPDGFKARYDELLGSTGMADAIELGQRFGVDVRSGDFWRASLDVVRAQIDAFCALVA